MYELSINTEYYTDYPCTNIDEVRYLDLNIDTNIGHCIALVNQGR